MAKRDYDKAASRFLNALRRIQHGLVTQQQRVLDRAARAPRLLPDSPIEVVDLTGAPGNARAYYIYELARLSEAGKSIVKVFGRPPELLAAQNVFENGIPKLRDIRNPLTHPNDNDELDEVVWFSSVVNIKPDGRVEELVDPRYQHHDYAMAYVDALPSFLRNRIQAAIAADPPRTLDEQRADRWSEP